MSRTLQEKEIILAGALVFEMILHLDVWAWDWIPPILFVTFPYHLLWATLEVVVIMGVFIWWGFSGWTDTTEELLEWGKKFEKFEKEDEL